MGRLSGRNYRTFFALIFVLSIAIIVIFLSISTFLSKKSPQNAAYAQSGSGYAVIRLDDGKLLLSENADIPLEMASTTKIMTALIALENCRPDEKVVVDKRAVGIEGISVCLKEGEELTIKELLYCLMLRSGNDAAVAIANHVAKNEDTFAEIMNLRAESIGLNNTHFTNPHGLHDEKHYTSAHDLAKITAIAMKNPIFAEIVGTKNVTVGTGESRRRLTNKNKILSLYDGANGVKTGYTKKSGRCLVSSATRNGTTLICVVLNEGDTYGKSIALLDKGFSMSQNA